METECNTDRFCFQPLGRREVVGAFDGGTISSDAGGLLLREVEQRTGIIRQFAACFTDYRDPELVEHTVEQLVAQRIYGLALDYEDLNVLGLAKNRRLEAELRAELAEAKAQYLASGHATRIFKDFRYQTLDSWSRSRRVVGKAEHLSKGPNPRFVVTSLGAETHGRGLPL